MVFSEKLLNWYNLNLRSFPWRETKDPYKIWISEIILQQTKIEQGLPYYKKFIKKYPTVFSLAKALPEPGDGHRKVTHCHWVLLLAFQVPAGTLECW